jgi:hypothetical protein
MHRLFMIKKAQKHRILIDFTKNRSFETPTRPYANPRPMKLWIGMTIGRHAAQVGVISE